MFTYQPPYQKTGRTRLSKRLVLALLLGLFLTLSGCGSSSDSSGPPSSFDGGDTGGKRNLTGAAQKGPFQLNSTVRLWQLSNGKKQGQAVTLTLGERGDFQFEQVDVTGPVLAEVQGRFFDEISGNFSAEELTLRAVLNLSEQSNHANINFFTHLIHQRMLNELANGKSFQAAMDDTLLEYELLTGGLMMPPHELDLLMANDESADPLLLFESAQLLLFSAAAVDLMQAQLDALSSGFAAHGSEDEDAQAVWAAIGQGMQQVEKQAVADQSAAAVLQQRLLDNYPMPGGLDSYDIDEVMDLASSPYETLKLQENCEPGLIAGSNNTYQLCYGQELELNTNRYHTYIYFEYPYPGSYQIKLEREEGGSGRMTLNSRYSIDGSDLEICTSYSAPGVCTVSTPNYSGGSYSYLYINSQPEPQTIKITATQISEGTNTMPVLLPLEKREHKTRAGIRYSNPEPYRYGSGNSSNNLNHYLFWLTSPAEGKRLIIDQFGSSCAGYGPMHFHLANESKGEVFADLQFPDNDCNLSYEFKEGDEGLYYLRVRQGRDLVQAHLRNDTSSTRSFRIRLEKPE